ncbi:MAG: Smr/MutS family protein [Bacteroidota bacterium]
MKYQVGDTVLILHSNEEAKVIELLGNEMLMVDVEGVHFPVYIDQVDFPYFKRFSEKKLFPQKKEKQFIDDLRKEKSPAETKIADGVWLSFLPIMEAEPLGEEIVKELKLHLINRTAATYNFTYHQTFFGKKDFDLSNQINPFENFYLHDIAFADLNDNPVFEFEFSLLEPDKKKALFFETSLKLKAKQVFTKIKQLREKNEASFSFRLFETYPDRKEEDKFETDILHRKHKVYDAKNAREHLAPAQTVIDLHIEKLSDDWRHLSNFEILSLQLKAFEKYYDLALVHHLPSMIVIHGVGEGKLRDEIHDILRLKKEVKSFVNQYNPLYGYGATEIFFEN